MDTVRVTPKGQRTVGANVQQSLRLLDATLSSKDKSIFRIPNTPPQRGKTNIRG